MWVVLFYQEEIKVNTGTGRKYMLEEIGVFGKGESEYICVHTHTYIHIYAHAYIHVYYIHIVY